MIYESATTQFSQILKNLLSWMEKANAYADHKKFDVAVLMESRLAPDQYNFIRQVQIACDAAKGAAARLAGQEPPKHEDNEKTYAEVRARVQKTIDFINSVKPDQMKDADAKRVSLPFMQGRSMAGDTFLRQIATPNFYFHIVTAYAILRHNGVDLGKMDFIAHVDFVD